MCGIVGVSGIPDAARLAYLGLYALQHRGQESAGIVALDRRGRAAAPSRHGARRRELRRAVLAQLPGDVAVGHTRYSTTGSTVLENAQPCLAKSRCGPLSIAHNGNLTNADGAPARAGRRGRDLHLLVRHRDDRAPDRPLEGPDVEGQIRDALAQRGGRLQPGGDRRDARCTPSSTRAASARWCSARLGDGIVVASETCALDLLGATLHPRTPARRLRPHRGGRGR